MEGAKEFVGYFFAATQGNGQLAMGNRILEAKQVARKKIFGHFLAATTSSGQLAMGNGVLEAKQVARKKFLGSFLARGSWKRQRATGWHRQRQRALATAPLKHEGAQRGPTGAKTLTAAGNGILEPRIRLQDEAAQGFGPGNPG